MSVQSQTVFLTGASSGIGAAIAEHLLREGYAVWGTSRNKERLARFPTLHPVEMHLEDTASVRVAWDQALAEAGEIDIVIQNAGAGLFGSIEEVSEGDARWLWSVVVDGPLHVLKLAAAHMRPRRSGAIIGIGSLAAELPMCFSAHYCAGKAALSALLDGLWMELQPFGVRVMEIRPGDISTAFNNDLRKTIPEGSAYRPWLDPAWDATEKMLQTGPSPDLIARAVLRLLREQTPPLLTREGSFSQAVMGPLGPRFLSRHALLQRIRAAYGLPSIDASERE